MEHEYVNDFWDLEDEEDSETAWEWRRQRKEELAYYDRLLEFGGHQDAMDLVDVISYGKSRICDLADVATFDIQFEITYWDDCPF